MIFIVKKLEENHGTYIIMRQTYWNGGTHESGRRVGENGLTTRSFTVSFSRDWTAFRLLFFCWTFIDSLRLIFCFRIRINRLKPSAIFQITSLPYFLFRLLGPPFRRMEGLADRDLWLWFPHLTRSLQIIDITTGR